MLWDNNIMHSLASNHIHELIANDILDCTVTVRHNVMRRTPLWIEPMTSVAVLVEISLSSPRKLCIFIIKKYICRIQISYKSMI